MNGLDRRNFLRLAGASLAVAFALPRAGAATRTLATDQVDAFLAIAPNGQVTLYTGKVELGQGIRTALAQMAAEELDLDASAVTVVEGDTDLTPSQGLTGGSISVQIAGQAIRRAAATARSWLTAQAASRLRVPAEQLRLAQGRFTAGTASVGFGELSPPGGFLLKVDPAAPLKSPAAHRVIGQSVLRVDVPAKVRGAYRFVQDIERPGMVHARLLRPAAVGATLATVDDARARALPGYLGAVRIGSLLAVTARDEWTAVRAAGLVQASWQGGGGLPAGQDTATVVQAQPLARDELTSSRGDPERALNEAGAGARAASYSWPMQTHGSIGPSCAVAELQAGRLVCWTASQATHDLKMQVAALLAMPPADVRMIYVDGAGCYGRNGHEDCAGEAALLARHLGKPVRVQWMRQEEHGWDPKGPPTLHRYRGAVGADGRISAWSSETWVPSHETGVVPLLPALATGGPNDGKLGVGLMKNNSDAPYDIPNVRSVVHHMARVPLRASWIRTPGRMQNAFAVESFMDELAATAGRDPVEFRLAHLADPRGRAVIQQAAERFAWQPRKAPRTGSPGQVARGQGMAYLRYNNSGTYVAAMAEVSVDRGSGLVKAERFVVAHDCGLVINPDGIRQNVEGNVLQTVSRVLIEEITFDAEKVTSLDWSTYPIARFSELPSLDVVIVNRPEVAPTGAGEPSAAAVPAAIANAIFDAVGVRLRDVPFKPAVVRAGLQRAAAAA